MLNFEKLLYTYLLSPFCMMRMYISTMLESIGYQPFRLSVFSNKSYARFLIAASSEKINKFNILATSSKQCTAFHRFRENERENSTLEARILAMQFPIMTCPTENNEKAGTE